MCKPHASQTVIARVRGDAAPEPATWLASRPSGPQLGRTAGGADRTIGGERSGSTRLRRWPAGDHHALGAHREQAPLMPPTATTLSAHQGKHDSKSTHMEDRSAKRPALRSMEPWHWHVHRLSVIADMASKSETCFL